ncbi:MAG: hypothetical protein C0603_09070 [Denitrovibrio sp.]|nr:MAG: hypothetical protein C0603_09070 [Denitrovibrio sp.]
MLKVEVFYNGDVDNETPLVADELKTKYGSDIDIYVQDIAIDTAPDAYGTINPPVVVIDGKQMFQLDEPEGLTNIVSKAIF